MAIEAPSALAAAARVTSGVSPSARGSGIGAVTRNGAGDYTIALEPNVDPATSALLVTARGTTPAIVSGVIATNGESVRLYSADAAGAAADTDLDFAIIGWR